MDFQTLFKRLEPKIKGIAIKLDGKYTNFNDDDLYQEAILHLWLKYQQNQIVGNTDSFLLQSCYYFLKNYIRKNYRKIDKLSFSWDAILSEDPAKINCYDLMIDRSGIEKIVNENLLLEDLKRILRQRERVVLSLSMQGRTCREIGRQLGISHVAVIKVQKNIRRKCTKIKTEIIED